MVIQARPSISICFNAYISSVQMVGRFGEHIVYRGRIFELDEAESSWSAGLRIGHDDHVDHFAEVFEVQT